MARRRSDIVVGVILIVLLVFVVWTAFSFFQPSGERLFVEGSGDVGVIRVDGMITEARPFLDRLQQYVDRKDIKAIVIRVESPGGIVAASQEMYNGVRRARESEKPVIISMGSLAASGAYYLSLGADSILANPGTLTGSIGVLMDFPQTTKLMDKLGITIHSVTSGPFKDAGSPYSEWDEQTQQYYQDLVANTYQQFVAVVSAERHLSADSVRALADGRVYTGQQAVSNGLIDGLGDMHDAVQLAARMAGISGKPTLVEPPRRHLRLWDLLFGDAEQVAGRLQPTPRLEYRFP